jgi:hypothetical protein
MIAESEECEVIEKHFRRPCVALSFSFIGHPRHGGK